MDRARELNIRGRSSMTKQELAEAINRANERETAEARQRQCRAGKVIVEQPSASPM